MLTRNIRTATAFGAALMLAAFLFLPDPAYSQAPVVKTVPWVASNPLIPHDTWSGKSTRLKGTCDSQGASFQYTWDFGDGSPVATGTVSNMYAIEASHAYSGAAGTVFTARLTVQNTGNGLTGSSPYFIAIRAQSLHIEVNVAIDEGLWYLHKTQYRYASGGRDYGRWDSGYAGMGYYSASAANVNAFEANGHMESGDPGNPYTETVARGLRYLFATLTAGAIPMQTNPLGTFNPDSNGNGLGAWVNQTYPYYQGGMFMDAIIASGTPDALTTTGPANIVGRRYRDIVQDMVDLYAYGQYDYSPAGGGWRYNTNDWPDNSACQWAAIGLIPAERYWGLTVPQIVKDWNRVWLNYSSDASGRFGYTDPGYYAYGAYATTPSGMVQMAMDGIGRGNPLWDRAETFIRNNFGNGGGYDSSIRSYYYGLFSFVKSMLLHDSNGDGIAEPIVLLQSQTAGVTPLDWYSAEAALGAPTDGVARTLVNGQNAGGYWFGHYATSTQGYLETAWAILMLNRTLFAGGPVAVAQAVPNPAVAGQTITLDGSDSFHQTAGRSIDSWEWDFNNDGTFDASGPIVTYSWPAVGDYPVRLRVTDDASPELHAETVVTVRVTVPPIAPTANAGGPYILCVNRQPFFLDGTGSVNPDEGQHQSGAFPGDTIGEYAWDLDGDGLFDDAFGAQPDVTAFFIGMGPGQYLIQLRVTDTTASSYPDSGMGNLTDTATAEVFVRAATEAGCTCVGDLAARPKLNKAELRWTPRAGAVGYNVYRGTTNGGPYLKIAEVGAVGFYLDQGPLTTGVTYYWVIRERALNTDELCQSNQASARPTGR